MIGGISCALRGGEGETGGADIEDCGGCDRKAHGDGDAGGPGGTECDASAVGVGS